MTTPEELSSRAASLRDEARYLRKRAEELRYLAREEDMREIEKHRLDDVAREEAKAQARQKADADRWRAENERR